MSAATVYISESNGAGEVVTDNITNLNFGSVDAPNLVAANHPVIVGEHAFFKMLRFKVQSLGTSSVVKDLRYWKSAGNYVAGEGCNSFDRTTSGTLVSYVQPTDGASPNPPFLADVALYTGDPGSARVGINGGLANQFPANVAVPGYSEYFVMQDRSTLGSTPVGPANTKTITLQYDET